MKFTRNEVECKFGWGASRAPNSISLLGEGERPPGTKAQHLLAYDAGQGSSNKREFWALRFFTGNLYVSTQPNY